MHRKHSQVWFVFIKYSAAYENLNWENNGGNTFCAFPAAVPQGAPRPELRALTRLQHQHRVLGASTAQRWETPVLLPGTSL